HPEAHRGAWFVAGLPSVARATVILLPGTYILGGRRIEVGVAALDQLTDPFAVAPAALVLAQRPLVPVELQPPQGVEDLLHVLRDRALAVGVLDPQHQGAAGVPGEKPVVKRRPGAADVQRPRRRRGEAKARHIRPETNRPRSHHG